MKTNLKPIKANTFFVMTLMLAFSFYLFACGSLQKTPGFEKYTKNTFGKASDMKQVKALVREVRKNGNSFEWEEIHEVPDEEEPEAYIRETIEIFNRANRCKYEFVKIIRTRRNG